MIRRYGKPVGPYIRHAAKTFTTKGNAELLENGRRILDIYGRQPLRTACKLCKAPLKVHGGEPFQGMRYVLCGACGHANGHHDDTPAFHRAVNDSEHFVNIYTPPTTDSYRQRVGEIYRPKVEFAAEALTERGQDIRRLGHVEIGSGGGYYMAALAGFGAQRLEGHELSAPLADLGNRMLGRDVVRACTPEQAYSAAASTDMDMAHMIFSLEHVEKPFELIQLLTRNRSIRFFHLAVPIFCLSSRFEFVFPEIFPRSTSGHTHLFTDRSIAWLCAQLGWKRIGEWWFGADAVDLLRIVALRLYAVSPDLADEWLATAAGAIDGFQLSIDQAHVSSEVHLILEKTGA